MAKRDRQGGLPVHPGRPADARRRGQGGGAAGGGAAGVPDVRAAGRSPTRRRWPQGLAAEGMRPVSGGTDTHLALIDLRELGVTGKEAEARCDAARITLNKNAIPYDPQPPMTASGIRVGTPAVTTQGMTEADMKEVAALIGRAVRDPTARPTEVAAGVRALVEAHPAYPQGLSRPGARVRAGLLHRRGGDLPADPGRAGAGAALGRGRPAARPGRARHPDPAAGRAGHVRRDGGRAAGGEPDADPAADVPDRLGDHRGARRRRDHLPARRAGRPLGARLAHQARRPGLRRRRHGAARACSC